MDLPIGERNTPVKTIDAAGFLDQSIYADVKKPRCPWTMD